MVTAFVWIQAERSRIVETAQSIAGVKYVAEVFSITGEWDVLAVLKMPSYEHLDEVVTGSLRPLAGIVRTQTMLAFRTYSPEQLDRGFSLGLEG